MNEEGPDSDYLFSLLPLIKEINQNHEVSVCIGGGQLVNKYSESIEDFDLSNEKRERCFIDLMKANVRFMSYLLDKKPKFDLADYQEGEVIVSGTKPGRSTDANAAELARKMGADLLIKLTDVSGIYDRNPKKFEDAEKIDNINFNDLDRIKNNNKPTDYGILDPLAVKIIEENKIKTVIIDGKEKENLNKVINGKKIGTWIE